MKEFILIASLVLSFCILILCRDYIVFMLKKMKKFRFYASFFVLT